MNISGIHKPRFGTNIFFYKEGSETASGFDTAKDRQIRAITDTFDTLRNDVLQAGSAPTIKPTSGHYYTSGMARPHEVNLHSTQPNALSIPRAPMGNFTNDHMGYMSLGKEDATLVETMSQFASNLRGNTPISQKLAQAGVDVDKRTRIANQMDINRFKVGITPVLSISI